MDRIKTHYRHLVWSVSQRPLPSRRDYGAVLPLKPFRKLAIGQIRQVMDDIF